MTDISKLSYEELRQLEKQIYEEILRKSKESFVGYKVTFCVKFNPFINTYHTLRTPEHYGEYLVNDIANVLVDDCNLRQSNVSGFVVEEMTDEDKEEWKVFWENDDE